jgi:hypothetical protein
MKANQFVSDRKAEFAEITLAPWRPIPGGGQRGAQGRAAPYRPPIIATGRRKKGCSSSPRLSETEVHPAQWIVVLGADDYVVEQVDFHGL